MDSSSAATSPGELFQKWKQFLDQGAFASAAAVAGDRQNPDTPLRQLIGRYLTDRASVVEATLTGTDIPPAAEAPLAPTGFTLLNRLGGGGMGVVYRVRDPLDREWALKLARREQLSAAGRERFLEEARAMARLDHPHLARIHHYDLVGDRPYFLMHLYPASLADRLAGYQADSARAVRLMAAVAEGVGHLHARGFIHRDLKPQNILLAQNGQPAVSDFGLVKSLTDYGSGSTPPPPPASGSGETRPSGARRSKTAAGAAMGTRRYMAPEQAAGLTHLASPQWDVWALGVILHELLTGRFPPSSWHPERLLDPNEPDNPAPATLRPGLDPGLDRVIRKCLARDPKERYPDGAAVARDLTACLRPAKPRRARRPWALAACLFVAAAGLTVAARMAWGGTEPEPERPPAAVPLGVVADLQARLRAGETVEVIPAAGMPVWSELVIGKDRVQPFLADDDGALVIQNFQTTLMELPPTGLDRFRFEVQVRQASEGKDPQFGIYAGRHRLGAQKGEVDAFLTLWFNDRTAGPGEPPPGRWFVYSKSYLPRAGAGPVTGFAHLAGNKFVPPEPRSYHTLAVEMRPTSATFFLDGMPVKAVPLPLAREDEEDFAGAAKLMPGTKTDFTPAGGYGLLVAGGTGAFRKATVSPLDGP